MPLYRHSIHSGFIHGYILLSTFNVVWDGRQVQLLNSFQPDVFCLFFYAYLYSTLFLLIGDCLGIQVREQNALWTIVKDM